ncbi:hypothetical protein PROAA_1040006 [Candidatus Propionivibrio aalborgensis]|uniref:Transposase TnpC homeodomain domain-containing protein n=1 Tax=Candidatus Propionivibrio aalborgensis TaxID=1860101 RepID=A0A1A8XDV0_9RHOO|nr:hypothetical protein PROAA_1040006 [Candidatus Propionivibrio aalborgensis]
MTSATGSRVLSLDEAAAYRPQQVVALSRELATAQHQIAWFKRQIFGQKSEHFLIIKPSFAGSQRCRHLGRVEMWRGSSRYGLSVCRPFRLAVPK